MRSRNLLIALAIVCLFAVPALCAAANNDTCRSPHGPGYPELSHQDLDNMTFGQLQRMGLQQFENASSNQSMLGKSFPGERPMGNEGRGRGGPQYPGGQLCESNHGDCHFAGESPLLLLMGDLDPASLGDMTLNQIKQLVVAKSEELNNTTISKLRSLEQDLIQARDNMTLSELKSEEIREREIARVIELGREIGQDPMKDGPLERTSWRCGRV